MLLDTREHVAEFNHPGPALAIADDELRARVRHWLGSFDGAILRRAEEIPSVPYSSAFANFRREAEDGSPALHTHPRLDIGSIDDRVSI